MEPHPEYKNVPLTIAFIFTLLVNVPQLWKTWKTKDVSSFSVYTMLMRILTNLAWIIYGVMEADILILVMSVEVVFSELLLLLFKQMYYKREGTSSVNVPMVSLEGVIGRRSFGDSVHVLVASV